MPIDPITGATLEEHPKQTYMGMLERMQTQPYWLGWNPTTGIPIYRILSPQSTNFMDYWRSQYQDVRNIYEGKLASRAMEEDKLEGLPFLEFMKNWDFIGEWEKMAPWARGQVKSPRGFWNV